jgi:hypothetical protein
MDSALCAVLEGVVGQGYVFDMLLPDNYTLTQPVIVTQGISDTPTNTIDGRVALREQRLQCSVYAPDLADARTAKEALIAALHGWSGGAYASAVLESGGPELYNAESIPPSYHLPVDFILTF